MSTAAGAPSNGANAGVKSPRSKDKGKGKGLAPSPDKSMEEEEDDDDDDDEDEEDEDDDDEDMGEEEEEEEEEEEMDEIDPDAIIGSGRRTRGLKVDYTSKEALEKAGLTGNEKDDDEDDAMRS